MLRNSWTTVRVACAALALTIGASVAWAYQVAPMIYDLSPSGPNATNTIRVKNDGDKPITIELVTEKRDFDETGKEIRTPADDDFVLFPPQAVVAPGKTQAVRVQYVGAPDIAKSVMYSVMVKQVPVKLPNTGPSGVQFVFNFGTVANVVPKDAKAVVNVVSVLPAAGGYQLRLRNSGNKYANLSVGRVMLGGGASDVAFGGDDWRKALGPSWLLPGHDRLIKIPAQSGLGKTVTARFEAGAPSGTDKS
jgi:fimbrial chaperone protein